MTPEDAIVIAKDNGLDLVEVAATSRPPVCRIMDYGKFKYEQKKKNASKKSHSATLKEVKLRPGTDQHDLNFKLNNARKFLMEGDKVKVTVMFRGREMVHTYRGREQLKNVFDQLGGIAKMESSPRMEGRFMSMILVADREAVAEAKRASEAAAKESAETEEVAAEAVETAEVAAEVVESVEEVEVTEEAVEVAEEAVEEVEVAEEAVEAVEEVEVAEEAVEVAEAQDEKTEPAEAATDA
jgi:translation initiation factor IF-3